MKRLEETGEPFVLTVNGRAKLVVQDAEAFGNSQIDESQIDWEAAREAVKAALKSPNYGQGRPVQELIAETKAQYEVVRSDNPE